MSWKGSTRKQRQRSAGISGWQEQRDARRILQRDGHACYRCGAPATEVDHVRPISRGGTGEDSNLRAICSGCHARKSRQEAQMARPTIRRPVERHPGLTPGGEPPPRGVSGSSGAADRCASTIENSRMS